MWKPSILFCISMGLGCSGTDLLAYRKNLIENIFGSQIDLATDVPSEPDFIEELNDINMSGVPGPGLGTGIVSLMCVFTPISLTWP